MFKTFSTTLLTASVFAAEKTNGKDYLEKSATEKSDIIWANINEDNKSAQWISSVKMPGLFTESMDPSFDQEGDEISKGALYGYRSKYIHTVGALGKTEWKSVGYHPYTGIFAGATTGYTRMSFAKEPSSKSLNTAPGIGVKFLRDGMDSANFVAMYALDGQESWNFFKSTFSNHISEAKGLDTKAIEKKFSARTKWILQVGLSDMATYGQDGIKVENPVFPY
jgi:hypothetical protein